MAQLTDRERRTVRLAATLLVGYLVLFYGVKMVRSLEKQRQEHQTLALTVNNLDLERIKSFQREKRLRDLRKKWNIDLETLDNNTVVSAARGAIMTTARSSGVGLSPAKEVPGRSGNHQLRVFQLSGGGKAESVMKFIHALPSTGYPLVMDNITITPVAKKPGQLTLTMTVSLLDYRGWKGGTGA